MRSFIRGLFRRFRRPKPLATSEDVTAFFLELFRAHGLPCSITGGWIVADSACLAAQARVVLHSSAPTWNSIQLDLEVRTPSGHRILESCGGFGKTLHEAIADAVKNICDGSFHVIYSAMTGQVCSHSEVENWEINEVSRRVFISPMVCRGLGSSAMPLTEWFRVMERHIKEGQLPAGLHWIRLYHFESKTALQTVSEVLLDNEEWPDLQKALAACDWPPALSGFYSVRIFLMVMDRVEPVFQ
jgi:hypothetical protein